uniref:Uncharacterized protein n=1 Tax=Anguilla anguilla TaxID=7936 RepID=A0A0E9QRD1_ANGAN
MYYPYKMHYNWQIIIENTTDKLRSGRGEQIDSKWAVLARKSNNCSNVVFKHGIHQTPNLAATK